MKDTGPNAHAMPTPSLTGKNAIQYARTHFAVARRVDQMFPRGVMSNYQRTSFLAHRGSEQTDALPLLISVALVDSRAQR